MANLSGECVEAAGRRASSKACRRGAKPLPEHIREMRLVRETGVERDPGDGEIGLEQPRERVPESEFLLISMDGGATLRKGADFYGRRRSFKPLR